MTALVWNQPGEHRYEAGLDRGVLYFPDGGGVAWNGLTAVEEDVGTSVEPVYFDGRKINDIVTVGDFSAVMKAFTYPEEFLEFEGILEDQTGLFIADQPHKPFHLSYRTKIGDDVSGIDAGYKIHLLYNLTAIPSQKEYETLTLDPAPMEFEWDLTAIPEEIEGFRPTAHIIIDSRKIDPWLLQDIESILYGDTTRDPELPPMKAFTTFVRTWDRLIIVDNGDGTWTAITTREGIIEMLDETTFQINDVNGVYLNADIYEITSSEKNEEGL